jgi:hypothetical protein
MEWFDMVEWFGRPGIETDEAREHRISMEAFVETYKLGVICKYPECDPERRISCLPPARSRP